MKYNNSIIGNKQKKSSWLFKLLISLAIIFAVLSVFAFALEFALALKIIFVSVAVIFCIGSIVSRLINRYKNGNPNLEYLNSYAPEQENYGSNIIKDINNYGLDYPNQYPNQYQCPSQNLSQDLNN